MTSCCPGWINYVELNHPELIPHLSSCKSPMEMLGSLVKTQIPKRQNVPVEAIYHIAVMPCTAKKYECARAEMVTAGVPTVDAVLTVPEFRKLLEMNGIDLAAMADEPYNDLFAGTSGAGRIFGASGGVCEAALRTAYATYEDAKEGEEIADGDFAQIDYSGTVDGKPISEIAPEAAIVAARTNFWVQLEEGRFLPEILAALRGMKIGETKNDVKAVFDKDAAPEPLKGANAVYTLTLKAFRHRILPTDEVLAEKAKAESYDALVATTRKNMEEAAVRQEAARRENEAVEQLLKDADFAVPASQVRGTRDNILEQFAQRAQYSGLGADYFEKNSEKILKDAEESATRQVRLWYIIDAIAKAENIPEGDDRAKKVIDLLVH